MLVTKLSSISNKLHTRNIKVKDEKMLLKWLQCGGKDMPLIQICFPDLTPDDREFILSGITPEEWELAFGDDV